MSVIRTFVGIALPDKLRARAYQLSRQLANVDVRATWSRQENLHITLQFLGDVPDTLVPDVCRTVEAAVQGHAPIAIRVEGAGAFPRPQRPRTVWLGVTEGDERLVALQQDIESGLHRLRFPREHRRYVPHVTLGRVRGGPQLSDLTDLLLQNARFLAGATVISQVQVFASYLEADGPQYQIMSRANLG